MDRKTFEVYLVVAIDDLLAGALARRARGKFRDLAQARQELEFRHEALAGSLGQLQELSYTTPDIVEVLDAQGARHSFLRAECVYEEWVVAVCYFVEKEGGAVPFHDAVGDLGDLELGAHRLAHVYELALFAQGVHELLQVIRRHP